MDMQGLLSEFIKGTGGPASGKESWVVAAYRSPGRYPFICGRCMHFVPPPEDEMENSEPPQCMVVIGPFAGGVQEADDCRNWLPVEGMMMFDAQDTGPVSEDDAEEVSDPEPQSEV